MTRPRHVLLNIFLVIFTISFCNLCAVLAYQIPTPRITLLQPAGFKVSIPDDPGLRVFAFHGKKNTPFTGTEQGNIRGQIGREASTDDSAQLDWVFTNNNLELQAGDRIHYWVYVQHNSVSYRLYAQTYEVPADHIHITTVTPATTSSTTTTTTRAPCVPSITTILGKAQCKGQSLFHDSFDRPSLMPIWQHEVRIPLDSEDAEFVSYQSDASVCSVRNGMLRIRPKLLINEPGFSRITSNVSMNFGMQCTPITSNRDIECEREAWAYRILPPIVSCKLNTKESFRFTYGRIEIRAKLPKGDWLFPELFLEPFAHYYGAGYDSGQLRVAYIRANDELYTNELENIGGHTISGGALLSTREDMRESFLKKKPANDHFGDAFHVYTLIWTDTEIALEVDGTPYGRIVGDDLRLKGPLDAAWRTETNMAPFDKEFYLSVGIGAGGIGDFPDDTITGRGRTKKPWRNDDPKAEFNFWQDYDTWKQTWSSDDIEMAIDYVRVFAI